MVQLVLGLVLRLGLPLELELEDDFGVLDLKYPFSIYTVCDRAKVRVSIKKSLRRLNSKYTFAFHAVRVGLELKLGQGLGIG